MRLELRKAADRLWSYNIASAERCELCKNHGTDAHHLIARRFYCYRHDINNGVWLCRKHHLLAHARKRAFLEQLALHCPVKFRWYDEHKNNRPVVVTTEQWFADRIGELSQPLSWHEIEGVCGPEVVDRVESYGWKIRKE